MAQKKATLLSKSLEVSKELSTKRTYKTRKKNKKIAKIRRQRGYHWEDTLVKRFNSLNNWKAFRLGSPSVALPDILVVNNKESIIFTIEAKSGTTEFLHVPYDQIIRCLNWTNNFQIYKKRKVLLAFKFLSKKRIGIGKYESRQLREFYKVWEDSLTPIDIVCNYEGETYATKERKRYALDLEDYEMPFHTKHSLAMKT